MEQVDGILTAIAANAIIREPTGSGELAPDPGDQHLWNLLEAVPAAILVTGDKRLIESAPSGRSVLLPGRFMQHADR
jgi:predicted nucleic acid-binding protein